MKNSTTKMDQDSMFRISHTATSLHRGCPSLKCLTIQGTDHGKKIMDEYGRWWANKEWFGNNIYRITTCSTMRKKCLLTFGSSKDRPTHFAWRPHRAHLLEPSNYTRFPPSSSGQISYSRNWSFSAKQRHAEREEPNKGFFQDICVNKNEKDTDTISL